MSAVGQRLAVGAALLLVVGLSGWWWLRADPTTDARAWRGEGPACDDRRIQPHDLERSLELGATFMLNSQKPTGNFTYEWDWQKRSDNPDDNEVRQAGATWGMALILRHQPDNTEVAAALDRALAFWDANARDDGARRWLMYPGTSKGSTGMVALVTLAVIERLRSEAPLSPERRAELEGQLDRYLNTLAAQRAPSGGFHSFYRPDGSPFSAANPYADGEALLATVKAARHLNQGARLADAVRWAVEDRERNVVAPRAAERDPDTTKGYYQWVSMAWYELAGSEAAEQQPWGEWLIELAVWMIDDHRTLQRTRNTSYAYEGIISAWAHADAIGDPRAEKLRCVIDQGMAKLTSWQLGHPLANALARTAPADDRRAIGGVMNEANLAPLRIDVTQHQMHAVILALQTGVTAR
jgi:hypothetical protein